MRDRLPVKSSARSAVDLTTLLYISTLARGTPVSEVAAIAESSRAHNRRNRITGLLLFDGARFAQLVEGPLDAIVGLQARLAADPRHVDMEVLAFGPFGTVRRTRGWDLGFHAAFDEHGEIDTLQGLRDAAALARFEVWRAAADTLAHKGNGH